MRIFTYILLFLSFVLSTRVSAQSCDNGSVNLGTINAQWVYSNADLQIRFPLSTGWYVYDYISAPKRYLRVGSDYLKISLGLSEMSDGGLIDLNQLKALPINFAPILLSISRLTDTSALVPSPEDHAGTASLSLRVYAARSEDPGQMLATLFNLATGKTLDSASIKDTLIGSMQFKYITIASQGGNSQPGNSLLATRKFGCVYVVARMVYQTEADLTDLFDLCRNIASGQ
ncbi:MAG TPA: hypothetical protein VMI35_08005 [Puia sp.]|nr:hypothetical protein [Puia sp.]